MTLSRLIDAIELTVFRRRNWVVALFGLVTLLLLWSATQLRLDAGFIKNIPIHHPYMQTYLNHQKDFGGANSILIAVEDSTGNIYNPEFFATLKGVHDALFFIPGVDRAQVKSLYSPSTRYLEVVEDGFEGGPVIPADFHPDEEGLAQVAANVEKAGVRGRLVATDGRAAMVQAQLQEIDPETGHKLDLLELEDRLEAEIRERFESDRFQIHIIGFAKMMGDIAAGARGVVLFFGVALLITALLVYAFCRNWLLTLLPLGCSLMGVVWQIGLLNVIGFGLDPMSILVPFLVFAIGVSHGVQMINASAREIARGLDTARAAQLAFRSLLIPGGIALLSDTIGFITILSIDIGIIQELAIAASLGVAVLILTNLLLLPLLISYCHISPRPERGDGSHRCFQLVANFARRRFAYPMLVVALLLFVGAAMVARQVQIGDTERGAPQLHESHRYNQDTFFITDHFTVSVDILTVIVEAEPESCTYFATMDAIDQFQWRMANVEGVQSVVSLPAIAKQVNAGFNEGNGKWQVLPRNTATLVQSVSHVPTSSGLLNGNCSVMPVYVFMDDHKAETIDRVVAAVKQYGAEFGNDQLKFQLASGPVGVMAAKNEAVKAAQRPMLLYVYGAVILLCLVTFRSLRATAAVILPLVIVSTLAEAVMVWLNVGLTVSTLPVVALGVGIGVDYGIYILSTMGERLNRGDSVHSAYLAALHERGNAVLFTGLTLAIGVSTWFFSDLKFQVDMGVLLTFMFLVNMVAAVVLLPAFCALFWPRQHGVAKAL